MLTLPSEVPRLGNDFALTGSICRCLEIASRMRESFSFIATTCSQRSIELSLGTFQTCHAWLQLDGAYLNVSIYLQICIPRNCKCGAKFVSTVSERPHHKIMPIDNISDGDIGEVL